MEQLEKRLSSVLEGDSMDVILANLTEIGSKLFNQGFNTHDLQMVAKYHRSLSHLRSKLNYRDEVTYKSLDGMFIARAIVSGYKFKGIELDDAIKSELTAFSEKLHEDYNLGISIKKIELKINDLKREKLRTYNRKVLIINSLFLAFNITAIIISIIL